MLPWNHLTAARIKPHLAVVLHRPDHEPANAGPEPPAGDTYKHEVTLHACAVCPNRCETRSEGRAHQPSSTVVLPAPGLSYTKYNPSINRLPEPLSGSVASGVLCPSSQAAPDNDRRTSRCWPLWRRSGKRAKALKVEACPGEGR